MNAQSPEDAGMNAQSPELALYCGFSVARGGFFSRTLTRLIEFFTGGDVSHAFFVFWSTDWNCWMTVGANANGVTQKAVPEFRKDHTIKYLFRPVGFSLWDGLRAHAGDLDKPYNELGLFGMALVEIGQRLAGRPFANLLSQHGELFCSQWMNEIVVAAVTRAKLSAYFLAAMDSYRNDQVDPALLCYAMQISMVFAPVDLAAIWVK